MDQMQKKILNIKEASEAGYFLSVAMPGTAHGEAYSLTQIEMVDPCILNSAPQP